MPAYSMFFAFQAHWPSLSSLNALWSLYHRAFAYPIPSNPYSCSFSRSQLSPSSCSWSTIRLSLIPFSTWFVSDCISCTAKAGVRFFGLCFPSCLQHLVAGIEYKFSTLCLNNEVMFKWRPVQAKDSMREKQVEQSPEERDIKLHLRLNGAHCSWATENEGEECSMVRL